LADYMKKSRYWGHDAARFLGDLGPEGIAPLIDVIKENKSQRGIRHALDGILATGTAAEVGIPLLTNTLKNDDWNIRLIGIQALSKIGAEAKPAIPNIIAMLGQALQAKKSFQEQEADCFLIFNHLSLIDPATMNKLFPQGYYPPELTNDGTRRWVPNLNMMTQENKVKRWQEIYDTLKKHYQKQK